MNTQSHAILNLFLLRKIFKEKINKVKNINTIIVFGSILPDIPMFFFFFWYTFVVPTAQQTIWRTLYFTEGWQTLFNLFNSIPIFLIIAGLAYYFSKTRLFIFALANLLHFVEDFFVHQEDAHAHFFPLSNYKFSSPISYWNSSGYGAYFSMIETIVILVLSIYLFKQIKTWWGKALLIGANVVTLFHGIVMGIIF